MASSTELLQRLSSEIACSINSPSLRLYKETSSVLLQEKTGKAAAFARGPSGQLPPLGSPPDPRKASSRITQSLACEILHTEILGQDGIQPRPTCQTPAHGLAARAAPTLWPSVRVQGKLHILCWKRDLPPSSPAQRGPGLERVLPEDLVEQSGRQPYKTLLLGVVKIRTVCDHLLLEAAYNTVPCAPSDFHPPGRGEKVGQGA